MQDGAGNALKSNLVSNQRLRVWKCQHQSVNVKRWGKAIWIGSETVVENNINNKKVWFKISLLMF